LNLATEVNRVQTTDHSDWDQIAHQLAVDDEEIIDLVTRSINWRR
jgi:hypothetical protein